MSKAEILPPDQQLENLAKHDFADLFPVLDDYHEREKSFVQTDVELRNPRIIEYTDMLADILCEEAASPEAKRISYGAFYFAYTVSSYILPGEVGVSNREYLAGVDRSDYKFQILSDADVYLSDRPTLRELIAAYLSYIDPSDVAAEVAQTVAAITFMHIEADSRELFIENEISQFEQEFSS